jgi:hypothetical protein
MNDPQDPHDPVAPDLKMPEVQPRQVDIRQFPTGVARNTDGQTEAVAVKPSTLELRMKREERRRRAFEMALDHVPYREIARRLGCNVATAFRAAEAYRLAQVELEVDTVERKRDLAVRGLRRNEQRAIKVYDSSTASHQAKMMAVESITKCIVEASKLEGTVAPIKVASTTPDGSSWAPLAVALQGIPTEKLLVLKEFQEMKILGGAQPMDAQVIDADVVPVKNGTE